MRPLPLRALPLRTVLLHAPLLVAAIAFMGMAPAAAQEAERPPDGIDRTDDPNWPKGLEEWSSEERNPESPDPQEAERRGLTSEEVKESLPGNPTEQGTRSPPADTEGPDVNPDFAGSPLYGALHWVRRAPPDLQGNPVRRPNALAREPLADDALTFPEPPAPGPAAPESGDAEAGQEADREG